LRGNTGVIDRDEYPGDEPPEAAGASFAFIVFLWLLLTTSLGVQSANNGVLRYPLTAA
jgi:hypothetical protein